MDRISFKENDISQRPAIELLQKLGYQYISPDEAFAMRGGKTSNVLLEEVLRRQLRELNSIKIGTHKEARFSEQNIENGVIAMRKFAVTRTGSSDTYRPDIVLFDRLRCPDYQDFSQMW